MVENLLGDLRDKGQQFQIIQVIHLAPPSVPGVE